MLAFVFVASFRSSVRLFVCSFVLFFVACGCVCVCSAGVCALFVCFVLLLRLRARAFLRTLGPKTLH